MICLNCGLAEYSESRRTKEYCLCKPEQPAREWFLSSRDLKLARHDLDLGEHKACAVYLYPHKDTVPLLTRVVEYSALERANSHITKLRSVLEHIATSEGYYKTQVRQYKEIARAALDMTDDQPSFVVAGNPADSECATTRVEP